MFLRSMRFFSKSRAVVAVGPCLALGLLTAPAANANEPGLEPDAADGTLIANPASVANVSASTASATNAPASDEPIEQNAPTDLADGDVRFRQLFASWSALANAPELSPGMAAPIAEPVSVSIPSLIPVRNARMSSGFGMRNHPVLRRRRHHAGIDLAAPTGTPIYASASGTVGRADWFSSYGLFISIDHGADLETRYAHLSRLAVQAGDRVEKGELIGYVGSTGRSTGPHLHYEVRVDGVAVNPIPYMVEKETPEQIAAIAN